MTTKKADQTGWSQFPCFGSLQLIHPPWPHLERTTPIAPPVSSSCGPAGARKPSEQKPSEDTKWAQRFKHKSICISHVKTALAVYNEGREGFSHLSTIDYLSQIYAVGLSCAMYGIYQHLGALSTPGPVTLPASQCPWLNTSWESLGWRLEHLWESTQESGTVLVPGRGHWVFTSF